ncbi:MAG: Gfo/Idh/MocA family oxidoreductase, partial [Verrucomicrobia bacterium]|nr:Gfo/Idh/MocA family oxidoreductase [Verrucomicrobiota bacterium]
MPARKCTVALLGGGPRGVDHAQAFLDNPERFEFVAICDRDPEKLAGLSRLTGGVGGYADAATMLAAHRPDVFCFVTPPSIRLPLLQLGLEHGARAIAFEKPVSLRIDETRAMAALLEQSRVRAVVSQQIKYRSTWRQAKRWLDAGEIGRLHTMQASSGVWHMQHGPHLTEYMSFFNDHHPIAWVHGTSFGGG